MRFTVALVLFLALFSLSVNLAHAEDTRSRGHLSFAKGDLVSAAVSDDHHYIAVGLKSGSISVFEMGDKKREITVRPIPAHAKPVTAVAFTPDGAGFVTGSLDGTVRLWYSGNTAKSAETEEGASSARPARVFNLQPTGITCLAVSPDSKVFAAGGADGIVRLAALPTGKPLGKFTAHKGAVNALVFDADGKRLATAGADKSAKVWTGDGDNWTAGTTIDKQPGPVQCVAFSPDGKRLATAGGADKKPGEVKVWDAESGKELASLTGHTETATWVVFHPKLDRILTAGRDKAIRVWGTEKGEELYDDTNNRDSVRALAISRDGVVLLSVMPEMLGMWLGSPDTPKK